MCGIHGIVQLNHSGRKELEGRINIMQRVTAHRGPDQSDVMIFPLAALATSRLSIVAPNEHSTIQSELGGTRYALFNGEIVNYRSLRQTLKDPPSEQTDTALILPLYREFGEDFAKKLAGMFAIVIYDPISDQLQLWRDPLGVKPLYYHQSGDEVIFSSEVKAIYAAMDSPPNVDFSAIDHILRYRFHSGRETVFPGIMRVLPGETVAFSQEKVARQRYWGLTPNRKASDPNFQMDQFRELLTDVVDEYAQADVKGGFFVSGGLDSSLVTAIALQKPSPYRYPISINFSPQPVVDEEYGKMLEKFLGFRFEWVEISDSTARQTLEELVRYIDEPLENPIHVGTYLMARRAHELGIKSVLTGDGSDEFFLGYERITKWLDGSSADPGSDYLRLLSTLTPQEAAQIYRPDVLSLVKPMIDSFGHQVDSFEDIEQVLQFERLDHLSEYHNMRLDRMTMAHGVEARVPFQDHRLVEFTLNVPITLLFNGSAKKWLGEIARLWLPDEIIDRRKVHFPSLPDQWLLGEGVNWAREVLLDEGALSREWLRPDVVEDYIKGHANKTEKKGRLLWALMTLELWLQNFI